MKKIWSIALLFFTLSAPDRSHAGIMLSDTTDLKKATALRGCNFIEVKDDRHLYNLITVTTEFACPEIVFTTYDQAGNLEHARSYPKSTFLKALRQKELLKRGKAYLILTRYQIYFIDKRKKP
ncbi:hypothetical protein [Fulvivirga imtechensis]|nr:hypothetical protein [Fulvivirga imtechensis]